MPPSVLLGSLDIAGEIDKPDRGRETHRSVQSSDMSGFSTFLSNIPAKSVRYVDNVFSSQTYQA